MTAVDIDEILAADLADWRSVAGRLHARFRLPDFTVGAAFVSAVAGAAEEAEHHPDITLSYGVVALSLCTHEDGYVITRADLDLARRISEIAAELELEADPASITVVEYGLDTAHEEPLSPFWSAILTGRADDLVDGEVVDSSGQVPVVWFQGTDEHEAPRQRWHPDVWVPHDQAQARVDAAVAAGGTVVDDSHAPSFVVLADADGNKVCVCTALDRSSS